MKILKKVDKINNVVSKLTWLRLTQLQFSLLIQGVYFSKKTLRKIAISQTEKGIKKYNKTILDCNYDDLQWKNEAGQEWVDGSLYILKFKKKI